MTEVTERASTIGTAKGVLFGIADELPHLAKDIWSKWERAMRSPREAREDAAWAVVESYCAEHCEALLDKGKEIVLLLVKHEEWGSSISPARRLSRTHEDLRSRFDQARWYGEKGAELRKAIAAEIRSFIDSCQEMLDSPEFYRAKQEWDHRLEEKETERDRVRAQDNIAKQKVLLSKKYKREARRMRDRAFTRDLKAAGTQPGPAYGLG